MADSTHSSSPIAVVGVSTLFPGSVDSRGFWRDILAGRDLITDVPPSHWLIEDYYDPDPKAPDKTYAKRGAFVPEVSFDPMGWGVPPSTVPATDTCQLLALIVAQRVLDDAARGQFDYADRDRMSVILGVTSAQELLGAMVSRLQRPIWTKALREMGLGEDEVQDACERIEAHYTPWQEATFPGVLGNVVAGRIANKLNLGGTNCVTDAACASTFSALSMAVNELRLGSSDVVLCGGADTMNDIFMYLCFSKTPALSKTGDCRPFSADGDGTMLGEGFGMVALKRLEDAERDGDRVYAVLRGVGSSSDGGGTAVYAPKPSGQAKAIRRAYAQAGFGPETVELVEAHGTGTIAGDAAEFGGLRAIFGAVEGAEARGQWCALGSVKSQIGHTKAAAGAAGLVKAVLALHHKALPPTIKVDAPNPKLDLEQSPFYLSTRARPWVRGEDHPRRAGVSSFGFGGSNFHLALEEYDGESPAFRRRIAETELVVLEAADPAALAEAATELAGELGACEAEDRDDLFRHLARSSSEAYAAKGARLAIVAKDAADLEAKLAKAAAKVGAGEPFVTPDGVAFGSGAAEEVAFLFPGQGSQYVDMGASVAMTWDDAREPWDLAASLEGVFEEAPLHDVVFPKPEFAPDAEARWQARLTETQWAQPAIGVASLSLLRLMERLGVTPASVGGHSFGEVIALHAAGVLSEEDAIRVARERGERMAAVAANPGAMTAVSAPADEVRAKVEAWAIPGLVLANHNGPKQIVLSGPTEAIEAAEVKLGEAKMRFKRLGVATAFHSEVVADATGPFGAFLEGVAVSAPTRPVYANSEAAPYASDAAAIRATLGGQIAKPVRFVEQIEAMYAAGARVFVEVGPGSVLSGLVGRILKGRPHRAVALDRKGRDGVTSLQHGLAQLVAAGVPMELGALWAEFEPTEDPRTATKPRMALKISGTNYGKPYPPKEGAAGLPKPNPKRAPAPASAKSAPMPTDAPKSAPVPKVAPKRAATPKAPAPAPRAATPAAPKPAATHAPPSAPAPVTQAAPQPSAPAPQTQAAPAPAPAASGWASAYLEVQRQAAEAHAAYTRAMADAHGAFLQTQQATMQGLTTMLSGQAPQPVTRPQLAPPQPTPVAPPQLTPAQPTSVAPPRPAAPPVPAAQPTAAPQTPAQPAPASTPTAAPAAPQPPKPAPATQPPSGTSAARLQQLMLDVVAEKTGYPVDMLDLSMDLEADL
ncbi:MAG: beta keto-acyl synthase, partial [Myxococcales bacterium]|nr:beta keto-acyl synthase [Myxococcales bacterium]